MKATKLTLVEDVARKTGYPRLICYETIEQFLVVLADMVAHAGNPACASGLEVRGFGRFDVVRRKGRPARNPRTMEPFPARPCFVLRWTAFPSLRYQVKMADQARKDAA